MKVIALVIGNDKYFNPDELKNAVNDASAIKDVFNKLGYSIIYGYNCNHNDQLNLLRQFKEEIKNYDASIFFYAGHGFQEKGENYLPSVDCQIQFADEYSLRSNSLLVSDFLHIYKENIDKTHIMILDACRKGVGERGIGPSFAPIDAPPGTLIAFSTSPNSGASDSKDMEHSVYTKALLTYIGKEPLQVEELFKKVRRLVATWTENKQIPWEHTSLITDFCFYTDSLKFNLELPYDDNVVRDSQYDQLGEVGELIGNIKIADYHKQNPAINKILSMPVETLDKNQQFILGRNLLQSSYMAYNAQNFFQNLPDNLRRYQQKDGNNHLFNGILFEIYFNSYGEIRRNKIKRYNFEKIMLLRQHKEFKQSFDFIRNLISEYEDILFYVIPEDNKKIEVAISVKNKEDKNWLGELEILSEIEKITVNGKDITRSVENAHSYQNIPLKDAIAYVLNCPIDIIELKTNQEIRAKILFNTEKMSINEDYKL